MTATQHSLEDARYWTEEGGERWVAHIDQLESMLLGFSEHLHHAVGAQPVERVLDFGFCGGPTSAGYARAVGASGEVMAVDISTPILKVAQSRYADLDNSVVRSCRRSGPPFQDRILRRRNLALWRNVFP